MKKAFCRISYFVLLWLYSACGSSSAVIGMNFDDSTDASYTAQLLAHPLTSLSEDQGVAGSKALEVLYVGNHEGSKRIVRELDLKRPLKEATLSFDVKFDKDFQFVKGGKLHGLGPMRKVTGGDPIRPDGWSARIMFNPRGKVSSYLYHQQMKGKYGDGKHSKVPVFTPGRYNHVQIYVKVNEPYTAANGAFELWVDGQQIVSQHQLQLRGTDDNSTLIHKLLFSTFHGGHMPEWAPKDKQGNYVDVKAWFDNIYLYKGRQLP